MKGSVPIESLKPRELAVYAGVCGSTLARAHARSGDRAAIAAYLGTNDRFERAICDFAETYAGQNERDFQSLAEAVRNGSVLAETGR
jgi:sugar/nucleoside kinase (ribokinase family)